MSDARSVLDEMRISQAEHLPLVAAWLICIAASTDLASLMAHVLSPVRLLDTPL